MTPRERQTVEAIVLSVVAQLAEEVGIPVASRADLPARVRAMLDAIEDRASGGV